VFKRLGVFHPGSHSFFRNSAIVASGQAIGYALALAASPVLSRLYGPREFGLLAVFVTLTSVFGTLATMRYDNAIPLPKDERTAELLTALARWMLTSVTLGLIVVAVVFGDWFDGSIFHSGNVPFTWLLVASVASFASCEIHVAHAIRRGDFGQLSKMRVAQAVTCLATQLCVPIILISGSAGLLTGQIAGYFGEFVVVHWSGRRTSRPRRAAVGELRQIAADYRSYPFYDVSATLLRTLALNGQLLMIAWAYGAAAAGALALSQRLLSTPVSMLSFAISRVYYNQAAALANDNPLALRALFVGTFKRFTLLCTPPLAIVCMLSPWTFAVIFGNEWRTAGVYCSILCPLVLLRVISFVIGPTLDVTHRQGLRVVRELLCVASLASGFALAVTLGWSELAAVVATTALGCVGYVGAIALTWGAISSHHVQHSQKTEHQYHAKAA
jgi:O-antigen/teichoic acid export membrane protein